MIYTLPALSETKVDWDSAFLQSGNPRFQPTHKISSTAGSDMLQEHGAFNDIESIG